ncbi:MAG: Stp1/IreP family PP2C-type Ser/Thr phosphatase [Thermoleophilia bacterium]|nr:Stp1/IreP family PP2C-type Ser/Thr phosphatase [Thermoleophilia bacterium]
MRLRHGSASHVGLVRRQNEDSFVARDGLYAVCDGMGGAQAGEVASETACRIVLSVDPGKDARQELSRAVRESNRDIREQSYRDAAMQGMGTTLTAAAVREETLTIAHVGDSRAYRLRDGRLEQLTQDHSLVAEMVRLGRLTPAQAASHPHRSIITRALGPEEVVQPDVFDVPLHVDDRLLFCSDGLSGMVSDREISGILGRGHDPQAMADALIRAALAGGGG